MPCVNNTLYGSNNNPASASHNSSPPLNPSEQNYLRMCFWNIHGLNDHKLNDLILGSFLKSFLIIFLTETWSQYNSENEEQFELNGFEYIDIARKHRNKNAWRSAGGIGIFISKRISQGVKVHSHYKDIIVWLKLDRDYFGMCNDVYVGTVYLPPQNSTVIEDDLFAVIQEKISSLPENSEILELSSPID